VSMQGERSFRCECARCGAGLALPFQPRTPKLCEGCAGARRPRADRPARRVPREEHGPSLDNGVRALEEDR
jgi:hypothetical protein